MKPNLLIVSSIFIFSFIGSLLIGQGNVGIGTNTPNSSAILDLESSNKGLLLPRMTDTQRNTIQSPADGLIIFNTNSGCINYYFSDNWYELCGQTLFTCGVSNITFTYNGSTVTYGTVLGANNRCWLDRNLGATQVATGSNDPNSYGDLFQWGRLDDGHQQRSPLSGTTTTLSNTDIPGHDDFIISPNNPRDWRNPQNGSLWSGINGINNPCPTGFRLPTDAEWETERLSWSSNNAAGAFNSPLKLPVAGARASETGTLNSQGSRGVYWSSSISTSESYHLDFSSNLATTSTSPRGSGFSVRCIQE